MAALLKKELAPLIEENLDKNLGIVTLTDVELQPDFKEAKVYISCFEDLNEKKVLRSLEEKAKEFQHILGRRLRMKFTPKITFVIDSGLENVGKVEKLLEEINRKGE